MQFHFCSALACIAAAFVTVFLSILVYLTPGYTNDFIYVTGNIDKVPTVCKSKQGYSIEFTIYEHPEITFRNSGEMYRSTNVHITDLQHGQRIRVAMLAESYLRLTGASGNFFERLATPRHQAFYRLYKEGMSGSYVDDPASTYHGHIWKFSQFVVLSVVFIALLYYANRHYRLWKDWKAKTLDEA